MTGAELKALRAGDPAAAKRHLEQRVREALDGTRLRGMPDLDPHANDPFRAIRVRGAVDGELPHDREVLVFCDDGVFRVACSVPGPVVHARPALDSDFLADDMGEIARRIAGALAVHCEQAGRSCARYAAASMLARRISNLL